MATKTLMAREDYLRTGFDEPEPDFVRGELVERTVPNLFHSRIQVRLSDVFKSHEDRRQLFRSSEIRLQVAPDKFRVADFAIFSTEPNEAVPEIAPYAVIEIVSPDDRYEEMMAKLGDYEEAAVEFIFVADPLLSKLSRYLHGDLLSAAALEMPEFGVSISSKTIFG